MPSCALLCLALPFLLAAGLGFFGSAFAGLAAWAGLGLLAPAERLGELAASLRFCLGSGPCTSS